MVHDYCNTRIISLVVTWSLYGVEVFLHLAFDCLNSTCLKIATCLSDVIRKLNVLVLTVQWKVQWAAYYLQIGAIEFVGFWEGWENVP